MEPMTSHERFRRMFTHLEADRVPIIDSPWDSTIERWQNEGMPKDVSYVDYFGLDKMVTPFLTDNSPQYPAQVLSESETDITCTSPWGVTMRQWKHAASTVEFLGFTIVDADSWSKAKERIHPSRDRAHRDLLPRATANLAWFASLPKLDIKIGQMRFVRIRVTSPNGTLHQGYPLFSQHGI